MIILKKERHVSHTESHSAFNHSWQNEMNRCLHQSLFGFFEFGNEFDLSLNELTSPIEDDEKNKNKNY